MSDSHWAGSSALRLLFRLQWRGRLRAWRQQLRKPAKLLAVLLALAVLGFFAWSRSASAGSGGLGGESTEIVIPLVLTFFAITSMLGALAQGTLAFTPAEAQFLLPGPVGTRALVLSQLTASFLKSLVGAMIFALFLSPGGMSWVRAFVGYGLLFAFLILLGSAIDLAHAQVPRDVRRRRAKWLGLGILFAAALTVALTCVFEGPWERGTGVFTTINGLTTEALEPTWLSVRSIRHLAWLGRPLAGILRTTDPGLALLNHALVLGFAAGLLAFQLKRAKGVREAASETSAVVAEAISRARRGRVQIDKPGRTSSGRLLPLLPRMGGAGPHIWRQLSILARQRKSYLTLVLAALFMGLINLFVTKGQLPVVAGTVLGWIAFMGPFYVQCDFRSDYDALAWMRSLPCSPTALAAGQILASAIVLTALEVALAGWVLLFVSDDTWRLWLLAFVALPFANVLQLAVENGAWLLFPVRADSGGGTPGAMHIGRMYVLILAKLAILAVAAVPWVLGGLAGGVPGTLLAGVPSALIMCAGAIWLLGRIFTRVDPASDLNG